MVEASVGLVDALRFSRFRLGRYLFYLRPPEGFETAHQVQGELRWFRMIVAKPFALGARCMGLPETASCAEVLWAATGVTPEGEDLECVDSLRELAGRECAGVRDARDVLASSISPMARYYSILDRLCAGLLPRLAL